MSVERRHAVDRIDQRDDAVELVAQGEIGVVDQHVEDRRGIGEAGGLDHKALERRDAAIVQTAQQILERDDQVVADGAAQAARGEQDHAVLDALDEEVVETDLAELVDQHDRVGEGRVLEQAVEQGGLAGA